VFIPDVVVVVAGPAAFIVALCAMPRTPACVPALRACLQILDVPEEDEEEGKDWSSIDDTTVRSSKAVVVKTSTRQVLLGSHCPGHLTPIITQPRSDALKATPSFCVSCCTLLAPLLLEWLPRPCTCL
jgi:hypothetical protein